MTMKNVALRMLVIVLMTLCSTGAEACTRDVKSAGRAVAVASDTAEVSSAVAKSAVGIAEEAIDSIPVDTLAVESRMGRAIRNLVVVPREYYISHEQLRYPVVYVLHGYDGNYLDWSKKIDLQRLADEHRCIVVCPDGQDSWYFDSPIDPKMQYETYMTKELIAAVDGKYRTIATRDGRAITGLSMGGHGALWLAWRHPDLYCACGSMSGGVDITKFPGKWKIHLRLGDYAKNKRVWAEHSVASLVPTLQPGRQAIIIDDGEQDFFYQVNVELHKSLDKRGIKHSFETRPGKHTWTYWVESLPKHMKFFDKVLAEPVASVERRAA